VDLQQLLGALLSKDSVNALSKNAGMDTNQIPDIVQKALPMLLQGMSAQAEDTNKSGSFAKALSDHSKSDTSDLGSFLSNVDLADGAKIIGHLLGGNKESVTTGIASETGVSTNQVSSLLSNFAPLIMSMIGQQTANASTGISAESGISIIQKVLSVFMGSSNNKSSQTDVVGQVLGSLLKGK
jgi:hypothetical protein